MHGLRAVDQVVLLDADLLPVSNIDHLFEMSAPAATFSSPWARTYRRDGYEDPFKVCTPAWTDWTGCGLGVEAWGCGASLHD